MFLNGWQNKHSTNLPKFFKFCKETLSSSSSLLRKSAIESSSSSEEYITQSTSYGLRKLRWQILTTPMDILSIHVTVMGMQVGSTDKTKITFSKIHDYIHIPLLGKESEREKWVTLTNAS